MGSIKTVIKQFIANIINPGTVIHAVLFLLMITVLKALAPIVQTGTLPTLLQLQGAVILGLKVAGGYAIKNGLFGSSTISKV